MIKLYCFRLYSNLNLSYVPYICNILCSLRKSPNLTYAKCVEKKKQKYDVYQKNIIKT